MAALVRCSRWRNVESLSYLSLQTAVFGVRTFQTLTSSTCRAQIKPALSRWKVWEKAVVCQTRNILVRNCSRKQRKRGVTGDQEQLWKSVLSGRGTGRRKKLKQQGVDPRLLGFGQSKVKFPVIHKISASDDKGKKEDKPPKVDQSAGSYKRPPKSVPPGWTLRGYTGTNWGGRLCGNPVTPTGECLTDFQGIILELRRVSVMKATGRRKGLRAMVAIGNYNGLVGLGIASGNRILSTVERARNKAAHYLYFIDRCDGHTIYHDFDTKYKACRMVLERKPEGYGLRCQRIMKTIATLAGLKDLNCKMLGSTTPLTVAKGTIQAFLQQETHTELAERTGLNVVEFRKENSYRPVVVAKPSTKSAEKTMKKIAEEDDGYYDFETIMDQYRGLHKPKTKSEIF